MAILIGGMLDVLRVDCLCSSLNADVAFSFAVFEKVKNPLDNHSGQLHLCLRSRSCETQMMVAPKTPLVAII